MRFAMSLSRLTLPAFLVCVAPAAAQVLAPNLIYTSVLPCRVFDTRSSGNGLLIHGVAQTFNVVGGNVTPTTFTGQGGHSGGCALPGFDANSAPQVQAVVFNFVAIASAGAGDIVAWPSDQAQPLSSIINYANSASLGFLNIANGIVVPVRQDGQGADITLKAQVSDTHVLADVVGYFSNGSAVQGSGVNNLFLGKNAGNPSVNIGNSNTAVGSLALNAATGGVSDIALGYSALADVTIGQNNIGVGGLAGINYTTEDNNIAIGNFGIGGDNGVIRIGSASQTKTFIAGISGATSASGTEVFVNSSGQLGTTTSSRRFKEDVTDMGEASDGLMRLRPVTFRYKAAHDDGSRRLQYGLIAEEVAAIYPDLVQYDEEGLPQAVRYHFVNAMLLNEVQRQHGRIAVLEAEMKALEARLARLEAGD